MNRFVQLLLLGSALAGSPVAVATELGETAEATSDPVLAAMEAELGRAQTKFLQRSARDSLEKGVHAAGAVEVVVANTIPRQHDHDLGHR